MAAYIPPHIEEKIQDAGVYARRMVEYDDRLKDRVDKLEERVTRLTDSVTDLIQKLTPSQRSNPRRMGNTPEAEKTGSVYD